MMKQSRSMWPLIVAAILFTITARTTNGQTGNKYKLTIIIEPVFNGRPLILENQCYVDEHKDTVYIDLFRFYLTNIKLTAEKGYIALGDNFLVDAADPLSLVLNMDHVPDGVFTGLSMMTGVDSLNNVSGANYGDLDPAKGMYWAWNSGYIMAKMEGRSKVCKTLHHAFEFHIGGYMPPYNTARVHTLALPQSITVAEGRHTTITIKADAAAWFTGNLKLAEVNNIVEPGKAAADMADRYAHMLTVTSIKNE